MPTLSQTATVLEERRFTGRERELAVFQHWISSGAQAPTILSVYGPGGAGKSALLRAFARLAQAAGRRVVVADGELTPLTPVAVLQTLGGAIEPYGVPQAEPAQPAGVVVVVVLIDAFDRRADLWRSM